MIINHPSIQRIRFRENYSSTKFSDTTLIIETDIAMPLSHAASSYSEEFSDLMNSISKQLKNAPFTISSLEIRPYRIKDKISRQLFSHS